MKYKISTLLLLLLLFTGYAFAAPAEAEYKKLHESWTLQADGSQEYRCYKELTIFTHTAMNGTYGETFVIYNPTFQEVKIHDSYTRQKDGSIVKTPANAFVEVLPRNADKAPAYNHLKELVIVHTGLELGATIILDYSVISRPEYLPEIDVCKQLLTSSPILEYVLTFTAPKDKPWNYETVATKVRPSQSVVGDMKQIKWSFRNLPAASRAPGVSMQNGDVTGLAITTYASPKKALEQLYKQFESSEEVTELAKEITKEKKTEIDKIQAIIQFVRSNIHFSALTLNETANQFRSTSEVIKTAYGTEAEKVALLNALLNASDIKASPAAAYYMNIAPENCGTSAINQLLVLAEVDGKILRLSPQGMSATATHSSFILKLSNAEKVEIEKLPAAINYQTVIHWKEGKVEAETKASFGNYHLSYSPGFANELLRTNGKSDVNRESQNTTISGKQSVNTSKQQDYTLLSLPATNKGIQQTARYANYNSKRTNNLSLPVATDETYSYTINLPDNLAICTPNQVKNIENSVGELNRSIKSQGKQVNIQYSLKLNKQLITPADYPAFRKLMTEWSNINTQPLLLKNK